MGTQCICYLYANVHSACQGLANDYCTAISQVYGREGGGRLSITHSHRERRREGSRGGREGGESKEVEKLQETSPLSSDR